MPEIPVLAIAQLKSRARSGAPRRGVRVRRERDAERDIWSRVQSTELWRMSG